MRTCNCTTCHVYVGGSARPALPRQAQPLCRRGFRPTRFHALPGPRRRSKKDRATEFTEEVLETIAEVQEQYASMAGDQSPITNRGEAKSMTPAGVLTGFCRSSPAFTDLCSLFSGS